MKKLIGILAIVGAIEWTFLMGGLILLMKIGHGLGDGASSGGGNIRLLDFLIIAGPWLFPMIAFLSVMLISFDLIKENALKICYWYAVTVLLALEILIIIFAKEILPHRLFVIISGKLFLFIGLFGFFCFPVKRANPSK